MDWLGYAVTLAVAVLGGIGGWASYLRVRAQNSLDNSTARKNEADAVRSLSATVTELSAEMARRNDAHEAEIAELRGQLESDIAAKDIRLRRVESDVIALKQKLSEWRAYAMGLYDMLIKLKETPPPPPATGPLG